LKRGFKLWHSSSPLFWAQFYTLKLSSQVIDSDIKMHCGDKYGAKCSMVEGILSFLGIQFWRYTPPMILYNAGSV